MKSPNNWDACSLRTRFRELEKLDASARPAKAESSNGEPIVR